jgi:hypothetical protein
VRDKNNWKLIGKKNPQLPQMFYPVDNGMTIRKGDTVAARCTMVNNRDRYTNRRWNSWTLVRQKDSSLLLYAIHSPFYLRIFKKTILFSGFKIPRKKSAKQESSSFFMNSISYKGKLRVGNLTKTRV